MHGSSRLVTPTFLLTTLHARIAVGLSFSVAIATIAGFQPSRTTSLFIVAIAVLLGMPHGALDVAIGPRLTHWALFFPSYGAAFGLAIAAWFLLPLAGLVVFLLISWFHFGSGDTAGFEFSSRLRVARALATGGLVLALPLAVHAQTVSPFFEALLFDRATVAIDTLHTWGFVGLAIAFPAAVIAMVAHVRAHQWVGVCELVCLMLLGWFATPLISFSMYFALWHAPRHMFATKLGKSSLFVATLASLVTVAAGFFTWILVEPSFVVAVRVVFIGLAALTVPHLVVTMLARRQ